MPTFAQPIWLYTALPIVLFMMVIGLIWAENRRKKKLTRFIEHGPLAERLVQSGTARRWWSHGLRIAAVMLIFVSLARPQWGFEYKEVKAKGIDLLIALDVSRSMLAEDVKPNRLERAKLAIHDLLDRLQGDRVGLITFAGDAFTQCPLTLDYDAFSQTVDSLDTSIIGRPGTNIAAAIDEAEHTFTSKDNHRLLILITDGEDLEAQGIQQAREAGAKGMRIFTVGVGSADGDLILVPGERGGREIMKGADGKPVRTRLDEPALRTIAESTNGFYTNLNQTQGLDRILDDGLADIPREDREAKLQREPIERYQWPLALAFSLFCLELAVESLRRVPRNTGLVAVILFSGLALITPRVEAATVGDAQKLFAKKDYAGAIEAYKDVIKHTPAGNPTYQYNLGVSQLKAGLLDQAEKSFQALTSTKDLKIQADSYYNLAAVLFQQAEAKEKEGKTEEASKLFKDSFATLYKSLQLQKGEDDAYKTYNEIVQDFIKHRAIVSIRVDPPGSGTTTANDSDKADFHLKDSTIKLKATANEGYQFVEWTGASVEDPKKAETTLKVETNTELVAKFVRVHKLTVEVDDPIHGAAGNTGDYAENSDTPVGAEPNDGFSFNHWEGEGIADTSAVQTTVRMDKDKTIKAYFDRHALLVVVPNNRQSGKTTGTGDPLRGEDVPITATANKGFLFDHWEGKGVTDPSNPQTSVIATGDDQDVIAVFRPEKDDQDKDQKDQDKQDKKDQKQDQSQQQDKQKQNQDSKSSESKDGKDQKSEEQKQQEEQKKKDAEKKDAEKKAGEKKDEASEQKKDKEAQQEAEQAREDAEKQAVEDQARRAAGVMTRQEALRLLETSRSKEKKLPLYVPSDENKDSSTEGRDW